MPSLATVACGPAGAALAVSMGWGDSEWGVEEEKWGEGSDMRGRMELERELELAGGLPELVVVPVPSLAAPAWAWAWALAEDRDERVELVKGGRSSEWLTY